MPPIPELEAIRRAQILSAAITIIGRSGYAQVTMADIAREANLSKGGLAHYFASKDDLFKEAFKSYYGQILTLFKDGIEKSPGPMDKILGFGLPLFIRETEDVQSAHRIIFDFMSLAAHNEDYRLLFSTWINEWVAVKKQALDEGVNQGLFTDHDTDKTARTISAIFHGIYLRWFLDPEHHTVTWAEQAFTEAITSYLKPYMGQTP
ncbi:transcriptional regulator BetI [Desulfatiferula olefinivorans]